MSSPQRATGGFSIGDVEAAFDVVAKDFPVPDYMQIYSRIEVEEICKSLNAHLGSFEGKQLLDVGSGPMDKTAIFARLGFQTFAVDDLSDPWHKAPGMVDAIKTFARRQGVTFHQQTPDNYEIPFEAGTFDVVMSIAVIEHLFDTPRLILNAMGQQLKPNGILVVVMPNSVNLRKRLSVLGGRTNYNPLGELYYSIGGYRGHVREYTLDETAQICRWSGFEVLEARTFEHLAQYKLKGLAQLVYLLCGWMIPTLRSGLLVVCRKPSAWKPAPEDPTRYFEAISETTPGRRK